MAQFKTINSMFTKDELSNSTTMADKVVLYSYFRSSASWRVRIALALKDIKYEYKAVNIVKDGGEQYTEEYRKMNPAAVVPTLEIDGHHLTQSLPIIEYINEKNPDPPLLPNDLFQKAQVRAFSEIINSGIQPLQNLRILNKIGDGKEEWAKYHIEKGFIALEAILAKTAGQYCFGDQITMADVFLVPQVYGAHRFKVDMTAFPIITRINEALSEVPAFQLADYKRQPDTPEDLRVN